MSEKEIVRKTNMRGFSVMISITGFAKEGQYFKIVKEGEKIVLIPTEAPTDE
ncbi:MAG: hypothetical protein OIN86_13160 [Candidatus Methanoperedens sp.]|nr:hypothetical protein [Candidatus Methanoperedens sp.]CAG0949208.1 hypothetical protein METP1_00089 [Methanosarcinales archaeon]